MNLIIPVRTAVSLSQVVDHIVPIAAGGTNHRNNLTASCIRCNQIASDGVWESLGAKRDYILRIRRPEILKRTPVPL